jgi:hypothetical protein
VRTRILSIYFVDDDNRLGFIFQRLSQNETSLCLRSIVGIDHEQDAIDHFHDALDFTAKIGVARSVHDVDSITIPMKGSILGANGDAFLRARDPSNPSSVPPPFGWRERCPIGAIVDH